MFSFDKFKQKSYPKTKYVKKKNGIVFAISRIMKLLFAVVLFSSVAFFQPNNNLERAYDSIEQAMNNGNAKELTSFVKDNLLLDVDNREVAYSRAQSEQILIEFFKKNKPSLFKSTYKGTDASNLTMIGVLNTENNKKFSVSLSLKLIASSYTLQQLSLRER